MPHSKIVGRWESRETLEPGRIVLRGTGVQTSRFLVDVNVDRSADNLWRINGREGGGLTGFAVDVLGCCVGVKSALRGCVFTGGIQEKV